MKYHRREERKIKMKMMRYEVQYTIRNVPGMELFIGTMEVDAADSFTAEEYFRKSFKDFTFERITMIDAPDHEVVEKTSLAERIKKAIKSKVLQIA